jgi:hypothetical protein
MSKLHPWDRYVNLKAGQQARAKGSLDLHWPVSRHSTFDMSARCTRLDAGKLEAELLDEQGKPMTLCRATFSWEESEPAPGTAVANTLHAHGLLGPLKFQFEDDQVEYEEKRDNLLELVADGTLDVSGPIDPQARLTLRVWKLEEGETRLRFVACRKNGKPLAEGDLVLKLES